MHPLDGPRLKIERAKGEIETLRSTEASFRIESDYQVARSELNPRSGNFRYRNRINSPPPSLEWGVHIGEIVHNLRSALDGLAFQLVLLNTDSPTRLSQFPVFLKRLNPVGPSFEGKRRGNGQYMIGDLALAHQKLIEGFQPYKRGRGGRNNPLYWLHEINNADKHRLIQVVGAKTGAGPFVVGWGHDFKYPFKIRPGMILKDGAIFVEAPQGVRVSPKIIPLIAFWDGCPPVKGKAVVNTLRIITNEVSRIIEVFAPEFD